MHLKGTVKLSRICPFCGRILLDQRLRINDLAVAAGGENAAKLLNLTVPFGLPGSASQRVGMCTLMPPFRGVAPVPKSIPAGRLPSRPSTPVAVLSGTATRAAGRADEDEDTGDYHATAWMHRRLP